MDEETRQIVQQTAQAVRNTAEANQNTAQALLNIANVGAPPQSDPDSGPDDEEEGRARRARRRLTAVLVALAVVLLIVLVWPERDPAPYYGVDNGLVFVRCDRPLLGAFRSTVDVWGVELTDGGVLDDAHASVVLPEHSRLAYACDDVGGLTRRLFDTGFRQTVVQVSTPRTGAERVMTVPLASDGGTQMVSPGPSSAYTARPHHGLAVFGPAGQTVWYRSANDGAIHSLPPSDGEARRTIGPDAVAFTVLTEEPAQFLVQGDATTDHYAVDLALPNPAGDMAAARGVLYVSGGRRALPLECSGVVLDDEAPCMRGGLGDTGELRPAAWLDDRTLLAFSGPEHGANALLRVEIEDGAPLRACAALPTSDWSFRAAAVHPEGGSYVVDAVRDGDRMLLEQPTDSTDDNRLIERPPPEVPDDAQLVAWRPDDDVRPPVPHVCGTQT